MRMPEELVSLLPVAVRRTPEYRAAVEENWEAFRLCFDAEPAALDAARRCLAVILPYGFDAPRRAANIAPPTSRGATRCCARCSPTRRRCAR